MNTLGRGAHARRALRDHQQRLTKAKPALRNAIDPAATRRLLADGRRHGAHGGRHRAIARRARRSSSGSLAVRDPRDPAQTLVLAAGGASMWSTCSTSMPDGTAACPLRSTTIADSGSGRCRLSPIAASAFRRRSSRRADGRRVYVVNARRRIGRRDRRGDAPPGRRRRTRVGFSPSGAALAGSRLLVTNEGLMRDGCCRRRPRSRRSSRRRPIRTSLVARRCSRSTDRRASRVRPQRCRWMQRPTVCASSAARIRRAIVATPDGALRVRRDDATSIASPRVDLRGDAARRGRDGVAPVRPRAVRHAADGSGAQPRWLAACTSRSPGSTRSP